MQMWYISFVNLLKASSNGPSHTGLGRVYSVLPLFFAIAVYSRKSLVCSKGAADVSL